MSRSDLDALLDFLILFAQQMLQKHGEFFPFGAAMSLSGEVSSVAGDVGEERPQSQEVVNLLIAAFRRQAAEEKIKASGICIDVRTVPPGQTEKTDAILARLEHEDGEAIDVYLPYGKAVFGKVKYGEIFAVQGTPQVFARHTG